jgi:hypothetical protein
MSVNFERGSLRPNLGSQVTQAERENQMPWDDDQRHSITNYKSNIAYKTIEGGVHMAANVSGAGYWYNNNDGQKTGAPPGDYTIDTISGNQGTSWLTKTYDATTYIGNTCRLIFHYTGGSSYTGDAQIGNVTIGSTNYSFESNAEGWRTTQSNSSAMDKDNYDQGNFAFNLIQNGTSANRWNRDAGGTGSGGTGLVGNGAAGSQYLYAEVSGSGYPSKDFICDSPTFVVDNGTFNAVLGMYGATIGTLDIYLRVIS